INASARKPEDRIERVADFLGADALEGLRSSYAKVTTERLANHVTFNSTAEAMSWWRNHNSHRPGVGKEVERLVAEKVAVDGKFRLAKNVFAVMLHACFHAAVLREAPRPPQGRPRVPDLRRDARQAGAGEVRPAPPRRGLLAGDRARPRRARGQGGRQEHL